MTQLTIPALFNFPPQAKVGRVLPKSKIYQHGRVSVALRERFVRQVEQITWQYKLARKPSTCWRGEASRKSKSSTSP
jgi:hypothetical protein